LRAGRDVRRSELRKVVLILSAGEGGFCSLETKHNRRMAPRPKLFVSKRFKKQRPQPPKTVLDMNLGENAFVTQ
jgi:hypothetical protein